MFARIQTVAFIGIEARDVEVQVHVASGLPAFHIVGLPDKAVAESRERVRAALNAIGLGLPPKRITINLAPADLPKIGSHYDLAIALGLMIATGAIPGDQLETYKVIGELGLDGAIRAVVGALPAAIGANQAGCGLICPKACGPEAVWASADMPLLAADHLLVLINHFKGLSHLSRPEPSKEMSQEEVFDLAEIKGQESAKRALEITAAGGHNLLMIGPPGSGKSMLAHRLPSILPPLSSEEMLAISMVQSLAGTLVEGKLSQDRPFRAPHHSATMAALVGGGSKPTPGEVALAHHGVLFLDELPEFSPQVLDALRQPLESGEISIARANHRITYPSDIQLVAAMNPCKCGHAFEPGYACRSGANCMERYLARVSGPLLDRIDIQIEVPAVSASDLMKPATIEDGVETSQVVRERVIKARQIQQQRYADFIEMTERANNNGNCPGAKLEQMVPLNDKGRKLLLQAAEQMHLSARGYHKTLRVARTLADLEGEDMVGYNHIAEALFYRGDNLQDAA